MDEASVAGDAPVPTRTADPQPPQQQQPQQQPPFRVLMVCTANRVRSAMAERMLLHALAEAAPQLAVDISGAGTRTVDGLPMFPEAAAELAARGIDASGFQSRALAENGVIPADLVLAATREHRSAVLERVPLALKRTFTLLEFAALVQAPPATRPADWPSGMTQLPAGHDPLGGGTPAETLRALVRQAAAQRGTAGIADDEYDIADPAGLPENEYRYAARLIEYATTTIARAFAHALRPAE